MMTSDTTETADAPPRRGWLHSARYYFGTRWLLVVLGGLARVVGASLK